MIRVEVEGYCSECMDFDPDVQKPQKTFCNNGVTSEFTMTDTVIRCENRKRCEHIRRYLQRKDTNDEQPRTEENK